MTSETLSQALNDVDAYFAHEPMPESIEIEMNVRLGELTCVNVIERATEMADLGGALERARLRLAVLLARGALEGFGREDGPEQRPAAGAIG
jgi:hypothetical protein